MHLFFVFLIIISLNFGQDSLKVNTENNAWYANSLPYYLMGFGLLSFSKETFLNNDNIKSLRNRYIPKFHNKFDDYMQFSPYAVYYSLNLFGLKSKHSITEGNKIIGTSLLISSVVVTSLKYSIDRDRPDNSSNNSFPSGHTATAFAAATFLHKEYGQTVSPYFSVGAYTAATATGIYRVLNNRHWMSDVFVGAGLGILSTEFAYYLLGHYEQQEDLYEISKKSVPLNHLFIRYNFGISHVLNSDKRYEYHPAYGFTLGLESAFFVNKYIGFGGHIKISSFPLKEEKSNLSNLYPQLSNQKSSDAFGLAAVLLGPYFKYDVSESSTFIIKALYGRFVYAKGVVKVDVKKTYQDEYGEKVITDTFRPESNFGFEIGASYTFNISSVHALNAFFDMTYINPTIKVKRLKSITSDNEFIYDKFTRTDFIKLNHFTIGLSYVVQF